MLTIPDVQQAMLRSGITEAADLDDRLDTDLGDLGCDSLALLDTVAQLQRQADVPIPDDVITEVHTVRELLDYVNDRIVAART